MDTQIYILLIILRHNLEQHCPFAEGTIEAADKLIEGYEREK